MNHEFPDGRSRFEPALRLAIEGRSSDAVRWLTRTMTEPATRERHGDEAAEALAEVARLAMDSGDPAAADEAMAAARQLRPNHADLLHQHAVVRLALGDRDGARDLLRMALEMDGSHVGARLERSMLDAGDGRLGEAMSSLRPPVRSGAAADRAPRTGPEAAVPADPAAAAGPDAGAAEARRELHEGRAEVAGRRVDALIERFPAAAVLHALRGEIEIQQGALDDALASCARALELDPDHLGARLHFARALEGLGMRDGALHQIGLVLERDAGNAEARALEERWSSGRRGTRGITASKRA